jgi:ABC-type transporter MlaC component
MRALLLLLCAQAALALGPLETLRLRDRQIHELLGEREPRDERLRALVNGIFDYETHARESFGRCWTQLGERERVEAVRLVATLLERSSMEKVREYRSDRIQYLSESIDAADPALATVLTRVTRGRERWEIGYRMRLGGSGWRIVDVLPEGASSIENNRAAFYKEIRAGGVEALLAKLRKKAGQTP